MITQEQQEADRGRAGEGSTNDSDVRHGLCVERTEANGNDTVIEGRTPQPVTLYT